MVEKYCADPNTAPALKIMFGTITEKIYTIIKELSIITHRSEITELDGTLKSLIPIKITDVITPVKQLTSPSTSNDSTINLIKEI